MIAILRHPIGLSRQEAALLPAWEKHLLVAHGKRVLGIANADSTNASAPDELTILTTPGVG